MMAERRGAVMRDHRIHREYNPMAEAKEVLNSLKDHYRLVILTSRRKETEPYTREWLESYYPGIFDEVVFSGIFEAATVRGGHLLTKGQQCQDLQAAYVIDDHVKHCASAAQAGAHAILFGNYPWNQGAKLPSGVARCIDWLEVKQYFDTVDTVSV